MHMTSHSGPVSTIAESSRIAQSSRDTGVECRSAECSVVLTHCGCFIYSSAICADESSRCIVKSICKQCKSVELEQTFTWWHTNFGQLDVPSDAGCPLDHEYKCKHIGHPGKCKYVCFNCKKWWDDCGDLDCGCSRKELGLCSECDTSSELSSESDGDVE